MFRRKSLKDKVNNHQPPKTNINIPPPLDRGSRGLSTDAFIFQQLTQNERTIEKLELELRREQEENKKLWSQLETREKNSDDHPKKMKDSEVDIFTDSCSTLSSCLSRDSYDDEHEQQISRLKAERDKLAAHVKSLEKTVESSSTMLEETIASVNSSREKAEIMQSMSTGNQKGYDVSHLVTMCKTHQVTIVRQSKVREKLEEELTESASKISDLTTKLQARDLELRKLEKMLVDTRHPCRRKGGGKDGRQVRFDDEDDENGVPTPSSSSTEEEMEMTQDQLRSELSKKNTMVKQLQAKIKRLEQDLERKDKKRSTILDLKRVSFLQEMLNASVQRLSLVSQSQNIQGEPSFLTELVDSTSLLQDYQRTSLHLLESKLSNDLAALASNGETLKMDEGVMARFEQVLARFEEVQVQSKEAFDHHRAKLDTKNRVIEDMIEADHKNKLAIESLEAELKVYHSLSKYSSISKGIFLNLKRLEQKEKVTERLYSIIEAYREEGNRLGLELRELKGEHVAQEKEVELLRESQTKVKLEIDEYRAKIAEKKKEIKGLRESERQSKMAFENMRTQLEGFTKQANVGTGLNKGQ